MLQSDSRHILP